MRDYGTVLILCRTVGVCPVVHVSCAHAASGSIEHQLALASKTMLFARTEYRW